MKYGMSFKSHEYNVLVAIENGMDMGKQCYSRETSEKATNTIDELEGFISMEIYEAEVKEYEINLRDRSLVELAEGTLIKEAKVTLPEGSESSANVKTKTITIDATQDSQAEKIKKLEAQIEEINNLTE